jgi:hypothetical protein
MVERICEQCGKPFQAKRSDAKYCRQACQKKAKRTKILPTKECISCGKIFQPEHGSQIYCSAYCYEYEKDEVYKLTRKYRSEYISIDEMDIYS